MTSVALWLTAVEVLGLATLPLTSRAFSTLPDRGYGFAKIVGVVLIGYGSWVTAMTGFASFGRAAIVVVIVASSVVCWWQWGHPCLVDLRRRWLLVALSEATFLVALGLALMVRSLNPDIVGQEKFMDLALMNAFVAAADLPTHDPWLAGFAMPYYHLGYLFMAVPIKIAGIAPSLGYNLSVAFVFAAAFAGTSSVVYALLHRGEDPHAVRVDRAALTFGLLGAGMLMLFGNLEAVLELVAAWGWGGGEFWRAVGVKNLQAAPVPGPLPQDPTWWWRASRVIPNIEPDGITEFPFFSFLLGDLHPHYVALPIDIMLVGLALVHWRAGASRCTAPLLLLSALSLGTLVATNTWDAPTFWGLSLSASVLGSWTAGWPSMAAKLPRSLLPLALALILIAPYFVGYQSQPLSLGIVGERTPALSLGILFGPLLGLATGLAAWMLVGARRRGNRIHAPATYGLVVAMAGGVLIALNEHTLATLVLLGALLALAGWTALSDPGMLAERRSSGALFGWLLATLAVAILVAVELVYVHDLFGTRMNTVFKLHYNAWVLLALAGATGLGLLWTRAPTGPRSNACRVIAGSAAALVVATGLVYPVTAVWTRWTGFQAPPTLAGDRFLRVGQPSDHAAIEWLRRNTRPGAIVVEAVGPDYGEHGRVSAFSGRPTLLGWVGHQLQWRGDRAEYGERQQDVDRIYRAETRPDLDAVAARHRAAYLFFGSLERTQYGPEAQARLARLLPAVFSQAGTTVYAFTDERVRGGGP